MYNENSSPSLNTVLFKSNMAPAGGGLTNIKSTPRLTNIVFSNNTAQVGGGIHNFESNPILNNIVFHANNSTFSGGGLNNASSSPIVNNAVFYANESPAGGAMNNTQDSHPKIKNCIFWQNTKAGNATITGADVQLEIGVGFNYLTATYCDMQLTSYTSSFIMINNVNSKNIFAQNPLFSNLADLDGIDNIWMTADDGLQLTNTSPCVNKGVVILSSSTKTIENNEAPKKGKLFEGLAITSDITGAPIVGLPDMGPYELQGAILPLNLLSFTGKQENGTNILNWKTANEINLSHFEIERSADAQKFEKIGEVTAIGESTENVKYEFKDTQFTNDNLQLFYRLLMVDIDGKFTFSKIIALENKLKAELTIYPNPTADYFSISGNTAFEKLQIVDVIGRLMKEFLLRNDNKYSISHLQKGIYYINIFEGNKISTQKVLFENK
jgi:hypothetical protein